MPSAHCFFPLQRGLIFLVLHVIWDCILNVNECEYSFMETLVSVDVFIVVGKLLSHLLFKSQPSSFVLSRSPWVLPCACKAQGSARDLGRAYTQTLRLSFSGCLLSYFPLPVAALGSVFWFLWKESLGFGFLTGTSAGQPLLDQSPQNGEFIPC